MDASSLVNQVMPYVHAYTPALLTYATSKAGVLGKAFDKQMESAMEGKLKFLWDKLFPNASQQAPLPTEPEVKNAVAALAAKDPDFLEQWLKDVKSIGGDLHVESHNNSPDYRHATMDLSHNQYENSQDLRGARFEGPVHFNSSDFAKKK